MVVSGVRVGLLGLGRAASFSLSAVDSLPTHGDVLGFDPLGARAVSAAPLRDRGRLVESVDALLAESLDLIMVATPTPLHGRSVGELVEHSLGKVPIWIEKPAAADRRGWQQVCRSAPSARTLLHTLFAAEVDWAHRRLAVWREEHGNAVEIACHFCEPHLRAVADRRGSLGGSWLDSGIAALAVSVPLSGDLTVADADGDGILDARVQLTGPTCSVLIETSWRAEGRAKTTEVHFADGARCLLSHHDGHGRLVASDGELLEEFQPGWTPLEQRYRIMFAAYSAEGSRGGRLALDVGVHELLCAALEHLTGRLPAAGEQVPSVPFGEPAACLPRPASPPPATPHGRTDAMVAAQKRTNRRGW